MEIFEKQFNHDQINLKFGILSLQESYISLITDQGKFALGTISIAGPPSEINPKATSVPLSMFGMKNTMLSTMLNRLFSQKLKVPVLSILTIKNTLLKEQKLNELVLKDAVEFISEFQNTIQK